LPPPERVWNMDVRSTDTRTPALKKAELERAQPVAHKPHGTTDDAPAARKSSAVRGRPDRRKPPEDVGQELGRDDSESQNKELGQEEAADAERHILDVRV